VLAARSGQERASESAPESDAHLHSCGAAASHAAACLLQVQGLPYAEGLHRECMRFIAANRQQAPSSSNLRCCDVSIAAAATVCTPPSQL
jgi:hypothetical protein